MEDETCGPLSPIPKSGNDSVSPGATTEYCTDATFQDDNAEDCESSPAESTDENYDSEEDEYYANLPVSLIALQSGKYDDESTGNMHSVDDIPTGSGRPMSAPILTTEDVWETLNRMGRPNREHDLEFVFTGSALTGKLLSDVNFLRNFASLRSVDVSGNCLKDVKMLGDLPLLKALKANENIIETCLELLSYPTTLKVLHLANNRIKTIKNLTFLNGVTHLVLSGNLISDTTGLSDLKNLKILDLSYNELTELKNFQFSNLEVLVLIANKIQTLVQLEDCAALKIVDVSNNAIAFLDGIGRLKKLIEIHLDGNKICGIDEFDNLKDLSKLHLLWAHSNPASNMSIYRSTIVFLIPQLQCIDGKRVTFEETRAAELQHNATLKELSYADHVQMLLIRAAKPAMELFECNELLKKQPPILLLVGAPRSNCDQLSRVLKHRFKSRVMLGGLYSTATTIEGLNPNSQIPVSNERFHEMLTNGDFIATCRLLGRPCGFAMSQITRAAEREAMLIATVPLEVALTLKRWELNCMIVLINRSTVPDLSNFPDLPVSLMPFDHDDDHDFIRAAPSTEEGGQKEGRRSAHFGKEEPIIIESIKNQPFESHNEASPQSPGTSAQAHMGRDTRLNSLLKEPHFELVEDNENQIDDPAFTEHTSIDTIFLENTVSASQMYVNANVVQTDSESNSDLDLDISKADENETEFTEEHDFGPNHKLNIKIGAMSIAVQNISTSDDMILTGLVSKVQNHKGSYEYEEEMIEFPKTTSPVHPEELFPDDARINSLNEDVVEHDMQTAFVNPIEEIEDEASSEEMERMFYTDEDIETESVGDEYETDVEEKSFDDKTYEIVGEAGSATSFTFEPAASTQNLHRIEQREAFLHTIMETRRKYVEFEKENPEFFECTLDSSNMSHSVEVLERLIFSFMDHHHQFSEKKVTTPNEKQDSSAPEKQKFVARRMHDLKKGLVTWNRTNKVAAYYPPLKF